MRAQSLIGNQEFAAQRQLIIGRRSAVEAQDTTGSIKPEQIREDLDSIVAPLSQLRATWKEFTPKARLRFERWLLPFGFVIGTIQTAEMSQFFRAIGQSSPTNSAIVPCDTNSSNRLMQEISDLWAILFGPEEEKIPKKYTVRRKFRRRNRAS